MSTNFWTFNGFGVKSFIPACKHSSLIPSIPEETPMIGINDFVRVNEFFGSFKPAHDVIHNP